MKRITLLLIPILCLIASCNGGKGGKTYFTSWNECASLTALKDYVKDVTDRNSKNFIPEKDRIVTFDMDGTFVGELYPTYFEYNLLEYRVLEDTSYKALAPEDVVFAAQSIRDYVRTGKKLPDHFDMVHAYAAAKAYAGMTLKQFDDYVKEFAKRTPNGFTGMTFATSFYKPMLDVFEYLEDNGFTYYVVSGSDRFICRALVDSLGIDSSRVIGMDVELKASKQGDVPGVDYTMGSDDHLIRTDNLLIKNLKTNKVKQITTTIGKTPVLSFGNSDGDSAMHNFCLSNAKYKSAAFMLVADDDARDHAKKWKTDLETPRIETDQEFQARIDGLNTKWTNARYNVVSMKNNFKTIYGDGVVKTDFVYNA